MFFNSSKISLINTVVLLRSCSVIIQMSLVLIVNLFLDYELPWQPLLWVIGVEAVFNGACFLYCRNNQYNQKLNLFIQLLADVCFLGCLLYFSGGATNAFVSLLLIPIAIAAVTLPMLYLSVVACSAVATYSLLLWLMPMSVMHGNMEGHFIAMWINFIFSAVVVSIVIGGMAKAITYRELTIAKFREKQLKQEKIIALGVASAQVTHDLATPLATIRLLTDELLEEFDASTIESLTELDKEVNRCSDNLRAFRQRTIEIKENKKYRLSCQSLLKQIEQHCLLNYPKTDVDYQQIGQLNKQDQITADSSLIPAVLNIINNAVLASKKCQSDKISIGHQCQDNHWQIKIRDFGKGFSHEHFKQLGNMPLQSEQGLGMAMLLSNASFERLGGRLALSNHEFGGAQVLISLPLKHNNTKAERSL